MDIKIIKGENRNRLICGRKDGNTEIADLGPRLPFHDIAHYVVERELSMRNGFYGNIFSGHSVQQLSSKEVINRLPVESAVAEIITRALQSLSTGACSVEQFVPIIQKEFELYGIEWPLNLSLHQIKQMLSDYHALLQKWNDLDYGGVMELTLTL